MSLQNRIRLNNIKNFFKEAPEVDIDPSTKKSRLGREIGDSSPSDEMESEEEHDQEFYDKWQLQLDYLHWLMWWLIHSNKWGKHLDDNWLGRKFSGAPGRPDCSPAECPQEWVAWQNAVFQFLLDALNDKYQEWLDDGNEGGTWWDFLQDQPWWPF